MTNTTGHRALRKGRVSLPEQVYLLTTVTVDRVPYFTDPELARTACRVVQKPHTWGDAKLLCWVLMPDHWHGLVELGARDDLAQVVNRFKSLVSKQLRKTSPHASIWARGFHDHALRHDEHLLAAARYILANPLRAGIVGEINDYPYWNSVWL